MVPHPIDYARPAGLELGWCPGSRGALAASLGCVGASALLLGVLATTPVQLSRHAVVIVLVAVLVVVPAVCAGAGAVAVGRIAWGGRMYRGMLPAAVACGIGALHVLIGANIAFIVWQASW